MRRTENASLRAGGPSAGLRPRQFKRLLEPLELRLDERRRGIVLLPVAALEEQKHACLAADDPPGNRLPRRRIEEEPHLADRKRGRHDLALDADAVGIPHDEPRLIGRGVPLADRCRGRVARVGQVHVADLKEALGGLEQLQGLLVGVRHRAAVEHQRLVRRRRPSFQGIAEDGDVAGLRRRSQGAQHQDTHEAMIRTHDRHSAAFLHGTTRPQAV
jgi:hypothetical protein